MKRGDPHSEETPGQESRMGQLAPLLLLLGPDEDPGSTTPVPEVLEQVPQAEGTREQILARHPEILAAICLGMRYKAYVSRVMGQRVTRVPMKAVGS